MEFLITIVVGLIVIGVALYLITLIPMDATLTKIIRAVVILIVVLWLLGVLIGHVPPIYQMPKR